MLTVYLVNIHRVSIATHPKDLGRTELVQLERLSLQHILADILVVEIYHKGGWVDISEALLCNIDLLGEIDCFLIGQLAIHYCFVYKGFIKISKKEN